MKFFDFLNRRQLNECGASWSYCDSGRGPKTMEELRKENRRIAANNKRLQQIDLERAGVRSTEKTTETFNFHGLKLTPKQIVKAKVRILEIEKKVGRKLSDKERELVAKITNKMI